MALFRELFADQVLSTEQIVSVAHITVMQVKLHAVQDLYRSLGDARAFSEIRKELERVLRVVRESGGAVVKIVGEGVLASFAAPPHAVTAALELHRVRQSERATLPLSIAIHTGPAMAATLDERLDYFGGTLQSLTQMIALAAPDDILASDIITQGEDVRALLQQSSASFQLLTAAAAPVNDNSADIIVHKIVLSQQRPPA
jgi:class 3 adenylate cyclase